MATARGHLAAEAVSSAASAAAEVVGSVGVAEATEGASGNVRPPKGHFESHGVGCLLDQQLLGAREEVVDVPATLASRVRVLTSGRSNKNDPNDALSVAVAALHAGDLRQVAVSDQVEVLRLLSKRNSGPGSSGPAGQGVRAWQ